ncbi:MAG: type ISP restriction/modification enzyme [Candidatus Latescibacterota bacterium]
MAENPIERYLIDLAEIHATGSSVPETSYYPALERLLTEIGQRLNPKVRCVVNPANRGAGIPDGGFFTVDQFRRARHAEIDQADPFASQPPARGVLEAKPPGADLRSVVESEQVGRYLQQYGLVLVTNLRAFALVAPDAGGKPCQFESFALAESEPEFWKLARHPRKTATERGERLVEYLRRVLLHHAPLAAPQDVAAILASYAHDARLRIEEADIPALAALRQALEEVLGLRFEGEKGEHFFRSTLIQTLFYGIFSAWVFWARRQDDGRSAKPYATRLRETSPGYPPGPFNWRLAPWLLRVPMLRGLFTQVADPDQLGVLNLTEVLDWAAAALQRVDRAAFFKSFDEGHAVQYFYEPFLKAFDPELRKDLGVWYTPEEIVQYQVERVDAVLRQELGLPDGLADPRVVVLDPCCGTGAYLRGVLRRIAATLHEKGGDALVAHDLKQAAMERVFGFEILPAPFVVAHLQLGLELEQLGAPLHEGVDHPERVGVYLTNALTGWEPPKEKSKQIAFPGFEEERDAAGRVKREKPILVILGNPPYNGFAGVAVAEERDLSEAYRTTRQAPPPQGQGLNDLYVRFFRMAERCITERGQGVVCFISNYSWLDGLSFTGMRERYLDAFGQITIDCLNGDKYKTGKLTPEGEPDPSVFSTEFSPEGIQVGTAIATLVKDRARLPEEPPSKVRFRHFWGKAKHADLLGASDEGYEEIVPRLEMGLSFLPGESSEGYFKWPLLTSLVPAAFSGVKTARDASLVAIDEGALRERMAQYFDPSLADAEASAIVPELMQDDASFDARETRRYLVQRGIYSSGFVPYYYRPLDIRWLYWDPETKLLDRNRREYLPHVAADNPWIILAQRTRKGFSPPAVTCSIVSYHVVENVSLAFPLFLQASPNGDGLSLLSGRTANLAPAVSRHLLALQATPETFFHHLVAVLHAPSYREENSGALRQDWPRMPLPRSRKALAASAKLGHQVAALLDVETEVPGVTTGRIAGHLKTLAVFSRLDGEPARPEAGDLDLTVGWGHAGKGGVTMPGKGRALLRGDEGYDVYLNEVTCWRNVPAAVWEFTIGGYQVVKKWLSYREKELLGRGLTPDEVRYVTAMVRRIAALLALHPQLDENYRIVAAETVAWEDLPPPRPVDTAVDRPASAR